MKKNMDYDVHSLFSEATRERQYFYIKKRIIIEEMLPMDEMQEFHWWVVNGLPVFTSIRYNNDETGERLGSYFSTRFRKLNMGAQTIHHRHPLPMPKKWDDMRKIARTLTSSVDGVVRLDMFANDEAVWFGEYTFTGDRCRHLANKTISSDALLYNILHGKIKPEDVTPQFVEMYVNG